MRHGSRYPDLRTVKNMHDVLEHLQLRIVESWINEKTQLSKDDIKPLLKWMPAIGENETGYMGIVKEGALELYGLARRYQSRFPELMPNEYSKDIYKVF